MKEIVIDCSVTMTWCFEDEQSMETDQILDKFSQGLGAVVPSLWRYEVLIVLNMAHRRGRIDQNDVVSIWSKIQGLPIETDELRYSDIWINRLDYAQKCKLTIYDDAYLELAIRRGIALATLDKQLRTVAMAAGVDLIPVNP